LFTMKGIALCAFVIFLLNLLPLHNILGKPVHTLKSKQFTRTTNKFERDAFVYLTKCGYNPCKKQSGTTRTDETTTGCQVTLKAMLKDFQTRNGLPITGTLDKNVKKLMKTRRCRTKDKPPFSLNTKRW
jgi:hypothetical protein